VELPGGIRTGEWNKAPAEHPEKGDAVAVAPEEMRAFFTKYYPGGLSGKEVLDVACNAGGYCFLAHELGARAVTGFDVRQHWLDQAEFLRSVKYPSAVSVTFQRADASQFLDTSRKVYDIVIFKGIFYHLPDPIHTLMKACDAAAECILVDTASSSEVPEQCLSPYKESRTHVMSGVHGLAWLPGGPEAVRPILAHRGFKTIELVFWRAATQAARGRFRLIGSRAPPPRPPVT